MLSLCLKETKSNRKKSKMRRVGDYIVDFSGPEKNCENVQKAIRSKRTEEQEEEAGECVRSVDKIP